MRQHSNLRYILASAVASGVAAVSVGQSVDVTINPEVTHAPISKYVYGQFVEHIGSLMNSGLWAEMVDDRKFYNPIPAVMEAAPAGRRPNRGRLRSWSVVGAVANVSMDTARPFVGKQSPRIAVKPSEPSGISQSGLGVDAGRTYTGRIVLSGDPKVQVSVSLIWGPGPADRQTIEIDKLGGTFRKFNLRFNAKGASNDARLEIVGKGAGSFSIGAVSLMPADNIEGFRREVIGVLKQLHSGVYRFPGGNFISAHEWRDAIGDPDRRAPKFDPVWSAVQPNDFGTDEFMRFCKLIEVEPYISVSAGFGDAWSARDYVEYCNGSTDTPMGRWRAKNGHSAPYRVKYWGIGNEAWGFSYQFGAMRLSQYIHKHNAFADAMHSVDPTVQLIGSGAMADTMTGSGESLKLGDTLIPKPLGPGDWTGGLFANCLSNMDLISEHFYNYGATHYDLAAAKQVPNDPNEPLVDWMRRPANHVRLKYEEYKDYEQLVPKLKSKPVPICLDEWAYAGSPPNSFKPVPAYAWTFHEMFRHSDLYQMACFTFATAMFSANRSAAVLNPAGLVFKMYSEHFGTIPVEVSGNSPQPKPTSPTGGEQPRVNAGSDTFPLDVAAAWTTDRKSLTIAVINPTDAEQHLSLKVGNTALTGNGKLWRMAPQSLLAVREVGGKSEVDVVESTVNNLPGEIVIPKHSVSIYELPVR